MGQEFLVDCVQDIGDGESTIVNGVAEDDGVEASCCQPVTVDVVVGEIYQCRLDIDQTGKHRHQSTDVRRLSGRADSDPHFSCHFIRSVLVEPKEEEEEKISHDQFFDVSLHIAIRDQLQPRSG